jgi:hypothetical protein
VEDAKEEAAYREVLNRWTRRTEVYEGLDMRLFAAATQESVDFRTAKAERLGAFQSMSREAVKALIEREVAASQQSYEFFLGVLPADRRWDDFDRPESIWRLSMRTSNGEVTPIQVERLGRPDVNTRGIYLYLGDFWTSYRVHFPVTFADGRPVVPAGEKQITLRISSAVAHTDLVFDAAPVLGVGPPKVNTAPTR